MHIDLWCKREPACDVDFHRVGNFDISNHTKKIIFKILVKSNAPQINRYNYK